jgi:nucleoside-triphosphatase
MPEVNGYDTCGTIMNPQRVFLTGEPGCGKTTAVRSTTKLLVLRGLRVGGMISGEIRERGVRLGFNLEDLLTHETGTLAHVEQAEGPRVGKYRVNLQDIERIGVGAIMRAIHEAEVVVVDELGPMELNSTRFIEAVDAALASSKNFLGTIHKHASHPLVAAVRSNPAYAILDVTPENRGRLPTEIGQRIIAKA